MNQDLEQRIRDAKARHDADTGNAPAPKPATSGTSAAIRAGSDLVAALAVGGVLGYWLDRWLDTKPWFMIALVCLGFVAGFVNIARNSGPPKKKKEE